MNKIRRFLRCLTQADNKFNKKREIRCLPDEAIPIGLKVQIDTEGVKKDLVCLSSNKLVAYYEKYKNSEKELRRIIILEMAERSDITLNTIMSVYETETEWVKKKTIPRVSQRIGDKFLFHLYKNEKYRRVRNEMIPILYKRLSATSFSRLVGLWKEYEDSKLIREQIAKVVHHYHSDKL